MAETVVPIRITGDERDLIAALRRSGRVADRELGGLERKGDQAGVSLRKVAAAATAAWAALQGARAVAGWLNDGVNAASNYEESLSKLRVIAGDLTATDVEQWAQGSATAIGASSDQALEMTGVIANLLKTVGTAPDQIGPMSTGIVELGADLASFHNVAGGTPEVLDKIRAGLVGEAEPLRTLGVLLSEARVKEEAYASGIAERGAKLTETQKVQARYNIILKDTADAQGDFARTSDGLANSQRILAANIDNLQREIGEALLPVVSDTVSGLNSLFTSRQSMAVAAYQREVADLRAEFVKIDGVDITEAKVLALFRAFEKAEDAELLVGELIRELDALGVEFDNLTERQKQLFEQALIPNLVKLTERMREVTELSFGEKIAAGVGYLAERTIPLLGSAVNDVLQSIVLGEEGTAAWRRQLLEFERQIPSLNAVLRRYGREEIDMWRLRTRFRKIDRESYEQYASYIDITEAQIRDELLQTGLFTRDEAEATAAAVVASATEQVIASREAAAASREHWREVRQVAAESGLAETAIAELVAIGDIYADTARDVADESDGAAAALAALRAEAVKKIAEDPFADLNASLGRISGNSVMAQAQLIATATAVKIARVTAAGGIPDPAWIGNAVEQIRSLQERTVGSVQGIADAIVERAIGRHYNPAIPSTWGNARGGAGGSGGGGGDGGGSGGGGGDDEDTTTTDTDPPPNPGDLINEFEGDPTKPVGTDLTDDAPEYDVFDTGPKPGTVGGDLIDAVDNLYDLPEGVRAMANLRKITEQGNEHQRSYFQQMVDAYSADGFTQDEIRSLLEQSGPIVNAIEQLNSDAAARATEQAALQVRALREGGVQLYNALVDGGLIEGGRLAPQVRDDRPTSPVFDFGDGPVVQIGSRQGGYRFVPLDQRAITTAGAQALGRNRNAYGAFEGVLETRDTQIMDSVNRALVTLVKQGERSTKAAEQTAANTGGGRADGLLR